MTEYQRNFLNKLDSWLTKNNYSFEYAAIILSGHRKVTAVQVERMRKRELCPTEATIDCWYPVVSKPDGTFVDDKDFINNAFGGVFKDIFKT